MRIVIFAHSLRSCWNHGNAHFLRGIVSELLARGHAVDTWEPADGWSATQLVEERGPGALDAFRLSYPELQPKLYTRATLDLDRALDGADLVLVHEWTPADLVDAIGRKRLRGDFCLLFHDTHHRAISDPGAIAALALESYDGVLAFGEALRELYVQRGWAARAWTWHEAADTRVFRPQPGEGPTDDLVWVGNWGDGERSAELRAYLFDPAKEAGLSGTVYGVRYPEEARSTVAAAGLRYAGWLPNHEVPRVFAGSRFTIHVPRGPYRQTLPGIPTIRVFEALACGIPLICAPWDDAEHLFEPGQHYLTADGPEQMARQMRFLVNEPAAARELAARGRFRILERHTCAHRVDQLLEIVGQLGAERRHP
jgi:spore maturation protein CgeB